MESIWRVSRVPCSQTSSEEEYAQGEAPSLSNSHETCCWGAKEKGNHAQDSRNDSRDANGEKQPRKSDILNLYLTEIYLGHGSYGIGAAAQNYFHKKVEELDIAEGALLAGLPQRPVDWDPFRNAAKAKERQLYVLKRMAEEKFIKPAQADAARNEAIKLYALEDINNTMAPYFNEYVRVHVMKKYGDEAVLKQGFKIYTTVRYDFPKEAEKAVDRRARTVNKRLGWRGVTTRFTTPQEIGVKLGQLHDDITEKLTPLRILPPVVDSKSRKLICDVSNFQSPASGYFGPTPVREGQIYPGVVLESGDARAVVSIGQTHVELAIGGMSWVKLNKLPVRRVSEVVHAGDLIDVKVERIDRNRGVIQASLEQEPEVTGALLSYDIQNGFVRAMVGGTDFNKSKFNCALQAKRQVGSTFKPIIYAAAQIKAFRLPLSSPTRQSFSSLRENSIPIARILPTSPGVPITMKGSSSAIFRCVTHSSAR